MDIQDNVYLTPADNRDDLIKRIVAVCEQIPPEFLLNAARGVSGRCRMCLRENGGNFKHFLRLIVYYIPRRKVFHSCRENNSLPRGLSSR
jgi:hypothetical protein